MFHIIVIELKFVKNIYFHYLLCEVTIKLMITLLILLYNLQNISSNRSRLLDSIASEATLSKRENNIT